MEKSELVEAVVKETHLSKPIVEKVINSVLALLRKGFSHPDPFPANKQEGAAPEQTA